jgi:hypothetical protein
MDTVCATTIVQEEEHGEKNSIGTKDSKFAQVYIDGEFAADNEVFVYNSTMLTFTATPANDEVQKITQEGNITLYMLCSGNDLNLCQNTGNTGDKSFAYLPPVVTEVTSTGARRGGSTALRLIRQIRGLIRGLNAHRPLSKPIGGEPSVPDTTACCDSTRSLTLMGTEPNPNPHQA